MTLENAENEAVIQTADDVIANTTFLANINDMVAKAVATAMKPAETKASDQLFAPSSHHAKPEIKSVLGASVIALYKAKNTRRKTIPKKLLPGRKSAGATATKCSADSRSRLLRKPLAVPSRWCRPRLLMK
jgi:hypothetical protein